MPFDQSSSEAPRAMFAGFGPQLSLFLVLALLAACGVALGGHYWALAVEFGGVALMLLVHTAWRRRKEANDIALRLIELDPRIGFLTDKTGRVLAINQPGVDRFGTSHDQSLALVLGRLLANPEVILSEMLAQIKTVETYSEDVFTRKGHFRLRVTQLGPARLLWFFDDRNAGEPRTEPGLRVAEFQVTQTGQITEANDLLLRLLGRTPARLEDVIADLPLRSGTRHSVYTSTGQKKHLCVVLKGREDAPQRVILLTDAEQDEAPNRLSGEWSAIEDLPVPLIKITATGGVLASNRQARHLLQLDLSRPCRLSDLLEGPGRPMADWLAEAASGQGGQTSLFLRGRGQNRDLFVQTTLNTTGPDPTDPLIVVLNDATELKSLERQFAQSQKMQAIGQLAGGIAHDFNNLLTAISGHCDLLLLNFDPEDQNFADLSQIRQNTNRAAGLVGQLLAFSRQQNLQPEPLDLRTVAADMTHLLNRLVGEKITLTFTHDPDLYAIKADKRQLEQVLMNLVVNARDAIPGCGDIQLATSNVTLKSALQRDRATLPAGKYALVKVTDTGCGMGPDVLSKIFDPFYTTKKTGEGTGLGLSTVYGIVKQSGGYIFVDSAPGAGTTFSIYFPRLASGAAAAKPPQRAVISPLRSNADGIVLLVEDEAPVRAFASRALRLRGFTVLEADCAEAALRILDDPDLAVDIFVTDVIMPGMDGPSWVRKALVNRPDTRVVFVSGYPEDAFDDGQPAVSDAVFLPKPFSLADLTETVQGQMQLRSAAVLAPS